jgi:PAS domain S-box-containing protein
MPINRKTEASDILIERNKELIQASHRFQSLFQGVPVACVCYGADGAIYEWNRCFEEISGLSAERLLQTKLWDLFTHEEDINLAKSMVENVFSGQTFENIWWTIYKPDGSGCPVLCNTFPLRDLSGKITGAISASIDMTERYIAELELKANTESLSRILETVSEGIITVDAFGTINFANMAASKVLGIPMEEIIGRNHLNNDWNITQIDGTPNNPFADPLNRALGSGERVTNFETTVSRPCGARALLSINAAPLFGPAGIVGGVSSFVDIQAKKEIEEELLAAHEELEQRVVLRTAELEASNAELIRISAETELIVCSIPSILICLDENDSIITWNTAAQDIFGVQSRDAIGRKLRECELHWSWNQVEEAIARCKSRGQTVRIEEDIKYTRPNGREVLIGVSVNPVSNAASGSYGILILGTDVTDRRILEAQLLQSQKLESIGRLAAGIAHEINTPVQYLSDNTRFLQDAFTDLTDLLMEFRKFLDIAREGQVTDDLINQVESALDKADLEYLIEEIPKATGQSLEGVERVAHLVRAMKDFSHPGSYEKTAIDLNRAIDSTLTIARNEWKYVSDIVMDFDSDLPLVHCFPGELNQVVLNIVINAAHSIADVVKDTNQKGTITVSTRRDGNFVAIRISDTGTGIPKHILDKIFDPFFTTKEVGRGTGQGLAISRSVVVDKHGGSIDVQTDIGNGTTFIIKIPIIMANSVMSFAA